MANQKSAGLTKSRRLSLIDYLPSDTYSNRYNVADSQNVDRIGLNHFAERTRVLHKNSGQIRVLADQSAADRLRADQSLADLLVAALGYPVVSVCQVWVYQEVSVCPV